MLVFSIFCFDEKDFCNIFPRPCPLAHSRCRDYPLLGDELREHEGALESRIFGGADFHVAVRGDVLVAPRCLP